MSPSNNPVLILNGFFKRLFSPTMRLIKEELKTGNKRLIEESELDSKTVINLISDLSDYANHIQPDFIVGIDRGGILVASYISVKIGIPSSKFLKANVTEEGVLLSPEKISGRVLVINDIEHNDSALVKVKRQLEAIRDIDQIFLSTLIAGLDTTLKHSDIDIDYMCAETALIDVRMPWSSKLSIDELNIDVRMPWHSKFLIDESNEVQRFEEFREFSEKYKSELLLEMFDLIKNNKL